MTMFVKVIKSSVKFGKNTSTSIESYFSGTSTGETAKLAAVGMNFLLKSLPISPQLASRILAPWWRHDQALKSIAEAISKGIKGSRYTQVTAKAIHFVKEGPRPEKTPKNCETGWWHLTWRGSWKFHHTSRLRPDIILVSEATKQLFLLELTVPWEERMEEAQERNREKLPGAGGGFSGGRPGSCQWRWAVWDLPATP